MTPLLVSQIFQIVLSVVLIGLVFVQSKGKGLATAFGSSVGFYGTRRGLEKIVFAGTIVSGVLLVVNSLILIIFA